MAGEISFFWGDCAIVAFWLCAGDEYASAGANAKVRMRSLERENGCGNFICAQSILTLLGRRRLAEFEQKRKAQPTA